MAGVIMETVQTFMILKRFREVVGRKVVVLVVFQIMPFFGHQVSTIRMPGDVTFVIVLIKFSTGTFLRLPVNQSVV